ncbi:MAG: hypothetical protein J1D86_05565 [Alistipes sp.]|nr:hypothetical protein [Alistipes sp.]
MKFQDEILKVLSQNRRADKIAVESDDLLNALSSNADKRSMTGFCTVLALAICSLLFIINFAIFLINDVIFFENEIVVSRAGAFMPRKACDSEQAIFMFNTSELWADTGIQLQKGDKIKISASGSFHSSIHELVEDTEKNRIPKYAWVSGNLRKAEWRNIVRDSAFYKRLADNDRFCLSPAAKFGAVLYQIRTDADPCRSDWMPIIGGMEIYENSSLQSGGQAAPDRTTRRRIARLLQQKAGIYELETRREGFRTVNESGTLHVAVNDIYLNDSVISIYARRNTERYKALYGDCDCSEPIRDPERIREMLDSGDFDLSYSPEQNVMYIAGEKFENYFKQHRDAWFTDNVGQIAITVDIQHRIPQWVTSPRSWYRRLETQLDRALEMDGGAFWRWKFWGAVGHWVLLLLEIAVVIPVAFLLSSAVLSCALYLIIRMLLWVCECVVGWPVRYGRKCAEHLPSRKK